MNGTRKSSLSGKITMLLVICFFVLPVQAKYGGGTGEPNDPYLINDANQMNAIGADSNDWDKHFKLMANINLGGYTGTEFNIIGYYEFLWDSKPFTGVFDGNDHTISDFTYSSTGTSFIGLFGYVSGEKAEIKNLGLINPNVDAGTGSYVSSLVGINGGTITGCYVEGASVAGESGVGGLVGSAYNTITNCYATANVTGDEYVGGLVGSSGGTVNNCYAAGSVEGDSYVGGLVGKNEIHSIISNCYATGHVSANAEVGGLVGHNWEGNILNCYATGAVDGNDFTGGLVGRAYGFGGLGTYTSCFWDSDVNPDVNGIGNLTDSNVVGKSTADMQTESTFYEAGWDFVGDDRPSDDWAMQDDGGYPVLWWQLEILPPLPGFSGGEGTSADPYVISNADELNDIGHNPRLMDKHFQLTRDIDLEGETFYIIGSIGYPFTGVFKGNDHTISNFIYTSKNRDNIGLFGYVDDHDAEIKNLGLIDPNVDAETGYYVGLLVGYLRDGAITDCYVKGGSVAGYSCVGGLLGINDDGTINNCHSAGRVSGKDWSVGGLAGWNRGTISNCHAAGSVEGNYYVGGLTGWNSETISNCHATASVTSDCETGGLVGENTGTVLNSYATGTINGGVHATGGLVGRIDNGMISNCYATGEVTGGNDNGGLVGYIYDGAVSNCYAVGSVDGNDYTGGLVGGNIYGTITGSFWDIDTSGQTTSDGGTGLPTVEMQTLITFMAWACDPAWTIDEGNDYPRLLWENMPGIPIDSQSFLGGGSGTQVDPYLIYTAQQLNTIGLSHCFFDKHFKLMADIDLSAYIGTSFNMIGTYPSNPFTGVFDGNGHKISNFSYTSTDTDHIGLFGYVRGESALIRDLGLINPDVDAGTGEIVGTLAGSLIGGCITDCYVGGGSVSGASSIGGLVGYNSGKITNSYSTGSVSGYYYDIGGLVGINSDTITSCYSTTSVSGFLSVGGLVGSNKRSGTVNNCYSTGSVSGRYSVGGLLGVNGGNVTASFWDIETSGQVSSAGGRGLPTAEMQMMSTFTDAGWDFVGETTNGVEDIWFIPEGDYPHLWWEGMEVPMKLNPGTLNCRSKGNWVKADLILPEGFTVADVDSNILGRIDSLDIEAEYMDVFVDEDGFVRVEMAFDRAVLCDKLTGGGFIEITVKGFLTNGHYFYGTETIKIK